MPFIGIQNNPLYRLIVTFMRRYLVRDNPVDDTTHYIRAHIASQPFFAHREDLWLYAFQQKRINGVVAEFGVWKGASINYFASLTQEIIYGFDSFEGLREAWPGMDFPAGHFSFQGKLPKVADNVRLIKGWFSETVPNFLLSLQQSFSFIHIDCDTYESARDLLRLLVHHFASGTIIIFDEYFGYANWKQGEYKAWQEITVDHNLKYQYLGYSHMQVAIIVVE